MAKKKKKKFQQAGSTKGKRKLLNRLKKSGKNISLEGSESVNMTKVFREYCAPLLDGSVPETKVQIAVQTAILVWNASLMPSPTQEDMLSKILESYSTSENREPLKYTLDLLLKRKVEKFDQYKKFIADVEFTGHGKKLRFDVATIEQEGASEI